MSDLSSFGRMLILFGVILAGIGGLFWILGRTGIPLGSLPGDLKIQRENMTCFIPLATSIVLSLLLTIILNLIIRLLNR
jgi:hypothetical protein